MKSTIKLLTVISALYAFIGCGKDGDKIHLSGFEPAVLMATLPEVILEESKSEEIALSIAWAHSELSLDDPTVGISSSLRTNILQVSAEPGFENPLQSTQKGASVSYSGKELNALLKKMALTQTESHPLYFRLYSTIAANQPAVLSNVVTVNVTGYEPQESNDDSDPNYLFVATKDSGFEDLTNRLYSFKGNEVYEGFYKAYVWENFRFYTSIDGDEVYGSKPDALYSLDKSGDKWDIWFDEEGFFFLQADLNQLIWTKTAVTSIGVTGDFNGWSESSDNLQYDAASKTWSVTCNIKEIGWGIKFIVNGDWNWCYSDETGEGELTKNSNVNIMPESAGVYKITVDLRNAKHMTYKLEKQD